MIMGPPYSLAAARHDAIEHDETTLTAGMAYLFSLACSSRSQSASPVTTPGLTDAGSGVVVLVSMRTAARGAAAPMGAPVRRPMPEATHIEIMVLERRCR